MFYRQSVQRRLTQLKYLQDRASLTQLPKDSVLHLLDDNFMVNKPLMLVPDDHNWLLSLQPPFKFLQHVSRCHSAGASCRNSCSCRPGASIPPSDGIV